jgi:pyridoxamine 5'-phosphate oxidase
MKLEDLRRDYNQGDLNEEDLATDPISQFKRWFADAEGAGLLEPNAMVLATVDAEGQPFTRTVLLKNLDERGFVFYTNFESRKGQHIATNARVSLLFTWLPLERQVSINGEAVRISTAESFKYFASRPLGSRLGAWTSPQSQVISSRSLLEAKLAEIRQKFSSGEVPLPSFWGGFRVVPKTAEFWQGRPSRLHDRFLYRRAENSADSWTVARLAP